MDLGPPPHKNIENRDWVQRSRISPKNRPIHETSMGVTFGAPKVMKKGSPKERYGAPLGTKSSSIHLQDKSKWI